VLHQHVTEPERARSVRKASSSWKSHALPLKGVEAPHKVSKPQPLTMSRITPTSGADRVEVPPFKLREFAAGIGCK